MEKVYKMYRDMYWNQIFNRKTSFSVKRMAVRSLWIMHKFNSKGTGSVSLRHEDWGAVTAMIAESTNINLDYRKELIEKIETQIIRNRTIRDSLAGMKLEAKTKGGYGVG